MVNKYIEEFKIYVRRVSSDQEHQWKWYYIVLAVSLTVILLVVTILVAKRYICSGKPKKIEDCSVCTSQDTDLSSVEHIYQHVYKNHKNPVYLVPFSALPENFDFSRSDITVRGDYIILKDLHVLEQPVIRPPSTPTTPTSPSTSVIEMLPERFQKQSPYNPNFY